MNPMKWWSLQNGGSLSDTRESINGFPCRLILVNDGEGVLNEGQAEPTSGNTKDMGIFNFNLDKGCTDSFGLDNSIFPQCVSYEVSANSDTTAGAFVPFERKKIIYFVDENKKTTFKMSSSIFSLETNIVKTDGNFKQIDWYKSDYSWAGYKGLSFSNEIIISDSDIQSEHFLFEFTTTPTYLIINDIKYVFNLDEFKEIGEPYDNIIEECAYLQSSFELRYPDAEEVGEDYGFLGMTVDGTFSGDYGLKRVVDFVGNSTDEEFVNNFEEYFNKEYTFRYFLLVMTLAMVDNLG